MGKRERASLSLAAERAKLEAAEVKERHDREVSALKEEMGMMRQEVRERGATVVVLFFSSGKQHSDAHLII